MNERRNEPLYVFFSLVGTVATGAIIVAGYAAAFGWRPAAWILVGGVTAAVAGHISIAVIAYRRVMRRPWPKVEPLSDDDWDD